jgi:hypothetical protein
MKIRYKDFILKALLDTLRLLKLEAAINPR